MSHAIVWARWIKSYSMSDLWELEECKIGDWERKSAMKMAGEAGKTNTRDTGLCGISSGSFSENFLFPFYMKRGSRTFEVKWKKYCVEICTRFWTLISFVSSSKENHDFTTRISLIQLLVGSRVWSTHCSAIPGDEKSTHSHDSRASGDALKGTSVEFQSYLWRYFILICWL